MPIRFSIDFLKTACVQSIGNDFTMCTPGTKLWKRHVCGPLLDLHPLADTRLRQRLEPGHNNLRRVGRAHAGSWSLSRWLFERGRGDPLGACKANGDESSCQNSGGRQRWHTLDRAGDVSTEHTLDVSQWPVCRLRRDRCISVVA